MKADRGDLANWENAVCAPGKEAGPGGAAVGPAPGARGRDGPPPPRPRGPEPVRSRGRSASRIPAPCPRPWPPRCSPGPAALAAEVSALLRSRGWGGEGGPGWPSGSESRRPGSPLRRQRRQGGTPSWSTRGLCPTWAAAGACAAPAPAPLAPTAPLSPRHPHCPLTPHPCKFPALEGSGAPLLLSQAWD